MFGDRPTGDACVEMGLDLLGRGAVELAEGKRGQVRGRRVFGRGRGHASVLERSETHLPLYQMCAGRPILPAKKGFAERKRCSRKVIGRSVGDVSPGDHCAAVLRRGRDLALAAAVQEPYLGLACKGPEVRVHFGATGCGN